MGARKVLLLENREWVRGPLINFFNGRDIICKFMVNNKSGNDTFNMFTDLQGLLNSGEIGLVIINVEQWGTFGGVNLLINVKNKDMPFIVISFAPHDMAESGALGIIQADSGTDWNRDGENLITEALSNIKLPKL